MIKYDFNYFMEENIGKECGISMDELGGIRGKAQAALERMERERSEGRLGFLDIPSRTGVLKDIEKFHRDVKGRFSTVGLIGIGGSALGPQAIKNALSHLYLNELDGEKRGDRCRVFFFDNVDPYEIHSITDVMDIKETLLLVISKSGGTTETNANFAVLLDMLKKKVGGRYKEHVVAITDPEGGVLRKIATDEGFASFPIPSNVGGRFSVLTPVGLVASAFMGVDIGGLIEGAGDALNRYYGNELMKNAPLLGAAFHYLFDKKRNMRINVLMPYTRKLFLFADWYRQLWAESLGKNKDIFGGDTVTGLTPVSALGVIDQHSQLQLYLEGPNDKVITFLKLDQFEGDVEIPEFYKGIPELDYISHRSLRELNRFEESATELVLKNASRPNASVILSKLDSKNVGEFIMFMELQTAYAGYLYDINPYDQPAVEQGKRYAFGLLNRPGFEEYRRQFEQGYVKKDVYIA